MTEAVRLDTKGSFALDMLSEAGVTIALDDFGTGFASLTHLVRFPVDAIKIHRSFVRGLEDARSRSIVRAIIDLGRDLRMQVVAEGVETAQQADWLQHMGCDVVEGTTSLGQCLALACDASRAAGRHLVTGLRKSPSTGYRRSGTASKLLIVLLGLSRPGTQLGRRRGEALGTALRATVF